MAEVQRHEFQAETRQLLELMIHSLYSHKEIFVRELISNASDALDRRRFESLALPELALGEGEELEIGLELDKDKRTFTVHDNGIGMTRDEVIANIGTIAKSGTRELWERWKSSADKELPGELIGQFGVGFYSAFMVADRVTLVTRKAGTEEATRWESHGQGTYEVAAATRDRPGTSVVVHLRPADPESELDDFVDPAVIRRVVKTYSDFVRYPIRLHGDILNSMKAIWRKRSAEVSETEYHEFYKHITHDWQDPLATITMRAEGVLEYHALLYIPTKAPFDLFYPGAKTGLQLYVKNVKIMDACSEVVPRYLRFLKGVVDSSDLPLNVSREILQHHGQIRVVRRGITKKVLDTLREMLEKERDKYLGFWRQFGGPLKEGVASPEEGAEQRDKLLGLLLFSSSRDPGELTTLQEYVDRMEKDQAVIYYLSGESRELLERSPHLEALRGRGIEVLYLTDAIDEFAIAAIFEFAGKKLQSAAQGEFALGSAQERQVADQRRKEQAEEYSGVLLFLQKKLADHVRDVRLSGRLTESPVCLVSDEQDLGPQMRRLLQQGKVELPPARRILEINPQHPALQEMKAIYRSDSRDPRLDDFAQLLLGEAFLAEGSVPPNAAAFGKLVAELMIRGLGSSRAAPEAETSR